MGIVTKMGLSVRCAAIAVAMGLALAFAPTAAFADDEIDGGMAVPVEDAEVIEVAEASAPADSDTAPDSASEPAAEEGLATDEVAVLVDEGQAEGAEGEDGAGEDADDEVVASGDKPSSLSSTMNASKGTLALAWGKAATPDATYEVCWREAGAETWSKKTTKALKYTITGLKKSTPYEVRVYVQGADYRSVFRFTATTKVSTGLSTAHALKATATAVAGASGYDFTVQYYGGSWQTTDAGEALVMSYQFEQGDMVGFKARPYVMLDGVKYEGAWSAGDYRFCSTVKLSTTLGFSARKLVASCAKMDAPAGEMNYRIVYRAGTSGKWNAQVKASSTRTVTKLSANKEYQVGAAPVVKAGGHSYLGSYTYAYRYCVGTTISKADFGGVERAVSWGKNAGASGYQLIQSVDPNFGKYSTTTLEGADATSALVAGLEEDGTYFFKVRAYKTIAGKNYYGPWSTAKASSESLEKVMTAKAQSYASDTKWLILVDCTNNKTAVFTGKKGAWELHRFMDCTTGAPVSPTVKGTFKVGNRGLHFGEEEGYTCWYWTQFYGDYLFHSVLYNPYSKTSIQDGRLGQNLSHGCVRLDIDDAKWIYDTISRNSRVVVYA